jgi:ketosteroid isomerase-like protein
MDSTALVHRAWQALSDGDLSVLEAAFAPDARWLAVDETEGRCENRKQILAVMRHNLATGLAGSVEEVIDRGDRTIVAFRPTGVREPTWPLDEGIRYIVLSTRDGLITEMKGCADRNAAFAYAHASSG